MALHAVLDRIVVRDAVGPGGLDLDPLDTLDVGNGELADDLVRHGHIVLRLRFFDLFLQLGESFRAVVLLVVLDQRLGVLLDLVCERRRRLADHRQRRRVHEEPVEESSAMAAIHDLDTGSGSLVQQVCPLFGGPAVQSLVQRGDLERALEIRAVLGAPNSIYRTQLVSKRFGDNGE